MSDTLSSEIAIMPRRASLFLVSQRTSPKPRVPWQSVVRSNIDTIFSILVLLSNRQQRSTPSELPSWNKCLPRQVCRLSMAMPMIYPSSSHPMIMNFLTNPIPNALSSLNGNTKTAMAFRYLSLLKKEYSPNISPLHLYNYGRAHTNRCSTRA